MRQVLREWRHQAEMMSPAERAKANADYKKFMQSVNENRKSNGERSLYSG